MSKARTNKTGVYDVTRGPRDAHLHRPGKPEVSAPREPEPSAKKVADRPRLKVRTMSEPSPHKLRKS